MATNSITFFTGYPFPPLTLEDPEEMNMKDKLEDACRDGNVEYVKTCLETKKEWVMKYPKFLHDALQTGNTEIVKLLLDAGMGADHMHTDGKDYLVSALIFLSNNTSARHENKRNNQKEIIRLLIEKGANIEGMVSGDFNTLVWWDAENTTVLIQAILTGDLDLIRYIIDEAHADIEARDEYGDTPLMAAVISGEIESVKFLVKSGAKINVVNLKEETPLTLAIKDRSPELVKTLVSSGAHFDKRGKNGWTPLHIASYAPIGIATTRDTLWFQ